MGDQYCAALCGSLQAPCFSLASEQWSFIKLFLPILILDKTFKEEKYLSTENLSFYFVRTPFYLPDKIQGPHSPLTVPLILSNLVFL